MSLQPSLPEYMPGGPRGSGRTTRQMQRAPKDAFYIVPGVREYYRDLADKMDRRDLRIHGQVVLDSHYLNGYTVTVVIDHACRLTDRQKHIVQLHNAAWGSRDG